ncbi:MAG: hypothetical protein U0T36_02910 [Saprospiraceae bacterium]
MYRDTLYGIYCVNSKGFSAYSFKESAPYPINVLLPPNKIEVCVDGVVREKQRPVDEGVKYK